MSAERIRLQSRHWFGKASAGLVLGLGLALVGSGVFAWLGPEGIHAGSGKVQFNMWLIAPIWVGVLSTVFLFRSSVRAWCWLGLANALGFGLLWALRLTMA